MKWNRFLDDLIEIIAGLIVGVILATIIVAVLR